mgnify:CR=1 FL=1
MPTIEGSRGLFDCLGGYRAIPLDAKFWRDAMDARNVDTTSDIAADGEVVWSWRSDARAKFAGYDPHVTVATKHGHRGDHV